MGRFRENKPSSMDTFKTQTKFAIMLIATRTIEKIKFKIYVTQTQTWSMTFSNQKNIGYKKTHIPPWSNWYFVLLIISVY